VKDLRVILISGVSGSGKTAAIKALEDVGFYCVDNLPIPLFPKFMELCEQSDGKIGKVAVVEDIRGYAPYTAGLSPACGPGENDVLANPCRIIQELRRKGYRIEILFLEASDEILLLRFSETRREHPLARGGSIAEGLRQERECLQGLRDIANGVIDTTLLNVHQLKERIQRYALAGESPRRMTVALLSFGYSYGIPFEADLLLDVRFLPNPYFVEELKRLRGNDPRVVDYVLGWEEAGAFLDRLEEFIRFLLPLYEREGKTHLTIAIGCTGGRHRSVVVVNRLAERIRSDLSARGGLLSVQHRDVEKG
jgi:UPF0042 nucleotide-binding protein